nr:hypothetical protein [uncultured Desulfobacter sp.]
MSDPNLKEEDDLISQDDIDKLMDISPGDDDAGEFSQDDIDSLLNEPGPDAEALDPGEEDAGELSQDDIDRMMAGNAIDDDDPEDDGGELSQDDIDSLLNEPGPDAEALDPGEEDAGELSQDDIDRMMAGNAIDDDNSEDDGGELSQDDIDQFMNDSQSFDSGENGNDDDNDDELISLEDIQGVMSGDTQGNDASDSEPESEPVPTVKTESNQDDLTKQKEQDATVYDAPVTQASAQKKDPFDDPIDENQATDVADCMITQETMDALIEAGLPAPDVPREDDGHPEAVDGDSGEDNLPDRINLMSETDDGGADDATPKDEDDVTQEDIDALLQQSDEKDELLDEDEDILISQDDINTLLMAADQEDEDVLGDINGEDDTSDLEDHLNDAFDDLESDSGQVVLEGIEDAEISDKKEYPPIESSGKGGKIKAILKSKVILAAASVLLFMGISVPLSYFLFFSNEPIPLPERQTASLTEIDLIQDGQDNVFEDKPVLPPSRRPGTILLTDFIILASDQSRTMTYVYADVSIDYSDQRAYDEINNNLAFYRDLIYEAIQSRLVSENNNEVTEADLLWGVEASLKKVLPPQYIDKISFKSFKTT